MRSFSTFLKRLPLVPIAIGLLCGHAMAQDRGGIEFFETKVRPILVRHCYECHSEESGRAKGGLQVDSREALLRGGDGGPAIVGRSAKQSPLYQSVAHLGDYQMPPKGQLPEKAIETLGRWIEMGTPDPRRIEFEAPIRTEIDIATGKNFWAYQPLHSQSVNDPGDTWSRSEIDRHVFAKLQQNGLTPVADASATVLVRRLFFAITGLPPSSRAIIRWTREIDPEQTGELNQDSIATLIGQLLSTKYYGERWGRHWLDVARFAESTGGDSNNIFQHAWRYRDYVIDSFNVDKPFDRFIQEQIAGDLLPIEDDADWANNVIATGFLAIGNKLVGEEDQQQFFADLVDEQIDATTRAFLATTVACARCHDHKSDPIPQQDYYALAAIFRSTETHYGLLGAQARQATTLLDLTGMGPAPAATPLSREQYADLIRKRDRARETLDETMQAIRRGENVFRGKLRRLRSDRDETEAALQAFDKLGNPRVFAMGTQDRDFPMPTRLLVRGEVDRPAQEVPRGFLQVLSPTNRTRILASIPGSGRLQLANWIASERNPLTARVIVNRVWHWMFGRGLVRTVDDFGHSGTSPSHPELLDSLALSFMSNGWSIKKLVRDIALSRTWQLSSNYDESCYMIDPDNQFLWRMNKRRLDAESIRDAMLAASGDLNTKRPHGTLLNVVGEGSVGQNVFEPVVRSITSTHRSVYLPRVRAAMPELLERFDAPDAGSVQGMRDSTSSPIQALLMMNHPFVMERSSSLAKLSTSPTQQDQIFNIYLRTLGRQPSDDERRLATQFVDRLKTETLDANERLAAYCQVLFCTTEFQTVD